MPQLTYNLVPPVGREGMLAAYNEGEIIIPRLAQGLVPVGKLCAPGTDSMTGPPLTTVSQNSGNPGQVKALPAGITDNPILGSQWAGVPIYDATREPYDSTLGYSCYADKAQVPVLIRGQLYGVGTTDPVTLLATTVLLIVVACVAGLVPARRAARMSPMTALRRE